MKSRPLFLCTSNVFLLAGVYSANAAGFQFLPISHSPDGKVTLRLEAPAGTNYVIEASQHLLYWFPMAAGITTGAAVDFVHDATNYSTLFYRAQLYDSTPPPRLTAQVDAAVSSSGLATVDGGSCVMAAPGGMIYRLNIPPRSVRDPTMITMTLVTNIAEWPFTNRVDTGVRLEPDGLELFSAARMEIEFPTNVPTDRLTSYTFQGDGTGLGLLPNRIEGNQVIIPVTHFSVFGAGTLPRGQSSAAAVNSFTATQNAMATRIANQLSANPLLAKQEGFLDDVAKDAQKFGISTVRVSP